MQNELSAIVYSKKSVEFITVAKEYCKFIESATEHSQKAFVALSLKLIPLLYLKASLLEESLAVDDRLSEEEDFATETFVTEIEYYTIENEIRDILGDFNEYPEVFESQSAATNEATLCFISEDLTDIYQDLTNCLQNYRNGIEEVMADALYEVANQFRIYWGQRCVNTMRSLHNALYNSELSDEISPKKASIDDEDDLDDDNEPVKKPNWLSDRFDENTENPFAI